MWRNPISRSDCGQQAAHQLACKTPGLAVVDADIGQARDALDIGGEGQHLGAALRQSADRFAHQRMVLCDQADTRGLVFEGKEMGGDGLGIKAVDAIDFDAEIGAAGGLCFDLLVQGVDEGVGACGQKERELDGGGFPGGAVWRSSVWRCGVRALSNQNGSDTPEGRAIEAVKSLKGAGAWVISRNPAVLPSSTMMSHKPQ